MQVTGIWEPGWDMNAVEPSHTTYIGHLRVCEELRLPTVVGNWEKTRRRLADFEIGKLETRGVNEVQKEKGVKEPRSQECEGAEICGL